MVGSSAQRQAALGAMPNDGACAVVTVPIDEINTYAGMRMEIEEMLAAANVIEPNDDGNGGEDNEFVLGVPLKSTRDGLLPLILRVGPTFRTKLMTDEVADRIGRYFDWTPFCVLPAKR